MCIVDSTGREESFIFPSDIDRTFWEVLSPDHLALLRNAIRWAGPHSRPLRLSGPGLIDIEYWKQNNSYAVHLVNLTNPMAMKGPFREIIPIGPLSREADLPGGVIPAAVRFLSSTETPKWTRAGTVLKMAVPRINLHEVIAIDL